MQRNSSSYFIDVGMNWRRLGLIFGVVFFFACDAFGQCPLDPPVAGSPTICYGTNTTLRVTSDGTLFEWFDAATNGNLVASGRQFQTPVLTATTTYYVRVNDSCASALTPVRVTVRPEVVEPQVSDVIICSGSAVTLSASGPGGEYSWFTVPSGGTAIIRSPDYTTPRLTATTIYYVQTVIDGCISPRRAVTVTVNPIPPAPQGTGTTVCAGSPAVLSATASAGTIRWLDPNGDVAGTGPTLTIPAISRTSTYYAQAIDGGCGSALTPVVVTVNPRPPVPSVSGAILCAGSGTTLRAFAPGGTYEWFDAAGGGTRLATGAAFPTGNLSQTTTFYVQTTVNGCTSDREPVTVEVLTVVPPPQAAAASTCAGTSAALTATGSPEGYAWYDAPTGGNLVGSGANFTTPALASTTTFYVESTLGSCSSTRTPVTVTVNPLPPDPVSSNVNTCPGSPATFTATGSGGTIEWFDAPAGGTLLGSGGTFTTPALNASTTYYVQVTGVPCNSNRVAVTATVTPFPDPMNYALRSYYSQNTTTVLPAVRVTGGTFTADPAGLSLNPSSGQINVPGSTPGSYLVTYTVTANGCTLTRIDTININPPAVGFSYPGSPFCQNSPNQFPQIGGAGAQGTYSATPAGLVIDAGTGEINIAASDPGTYTVTNTVPGNSTTSTTVTIVPAALVDAGSDQTVSSSTAVALNGSVSNANGVAWSGGTGSFSPSNTVVNPVYTPGPGETTATLTLTATFTAGNCPTTSDQVTFTFVQPPVTSGTTVCYDTPAVLSVAAPAGTIEWFDGQFGGSPLFQGPSYTTPALVISRSYWVQSTVNGVSGPRSEARVTVRPQVQPPVVAAATVCYSTAATLTATGADSYRWYDAATGGNLVSSRSTYTTPRLTTAATFYVEGTLNGCPSPRTAVPVSINPVAAVTSAETAASCSGRALNYQITSNVSGATFTWSRAAIPGISNSAVTGQVSAQITETLLNTTGANIRVTYRILPEANSCPGTPFDLVVTVAPVPSVSSSATQTVCNSTAPNYAFSFNTGGVSYSWSRAAIPGISNPAISGQTAPVIREVLTNTTAAPVTAIYTVNFATSLCGSFAFSYRLTVNPTIRVNSAAAGQVCSGVSQNYTITATSDSASFTWRRNAVAGISNPAVSNQPSNRITEALINTTNGPIDVVYTITQTAFGCVQPSFNYRVTVFPKPQTPAITTDAAVCRGDQIRLSTPALANATYAWSGPASFTSTSRTPVINGAARVNSGTYTLVVTVNGCLSSTGSATVFVADPPVSSAGPDQQVCAGVPEVQLTGAVAGGSGEGVWSTTGSGTFWPSPTFLNATYRPTSADTTAGSVTLTLTSINNLSCPVSTDAMVIRFEHLPVVIAGPDQELCSQVTGVAISGAIRNAAGGIWTTTGTGTFLPSASSLAATYVPSAADIQKGLIVLRLSSTGNGLCYTISDEVQLRFIPPPTLDAGENRLVMLGKSITLQPKVSDENVTYLWTPNFSLSNNTVKNPVVTGVESQTYTLTITDVRGCISTDTVHVKVLNPVTIFNTFTPNGDGVNDVWNIPELKEYPGPTLTIFTRYGEPVYTAKGYDNPWDGNWKGQQLPVGVYYYVIHTNFEGQVFSGYITLLR